MTASITTTPAEIDGRMVEFLIEASRAEFAASQAINSWHRSAGDTRDRQGYWKITTEAARLIVMERTASGAASLLADEIRTRGEFTQANAKAQALNELWGHEHWTRYYFCTNTNGHIHTSERGCSTVRPTTAMAFQPQLSGLTPAEVVEQVGPALCSVCYPGAPVEHTSSNLTEIEREKTRGERDAAKAARDAKNAAKRLDPAHNEPFRARDGHERIETVAACQAVIRDAIDQQARVEFYGGRTAAQSGWDDEAHFAQFLASINRSLNEQWADAAQATAVLIAREARHEGYGMTAEAIETMRARKLTASRKAWARNAA